MLKQLFTAAAILGVLASPALALTITNQDKAPHIITINMGKGADEVKLEIGPGESVSQNCPKRCTVSIEAKESRLVMASADDALLIKGNKLQHDTSKSGAPGSHQGGAASPGNSEDSGETPEKDAD